ncbi:hypothetical protein N1030_06555 [Desulfovibrio mangrovi]|uniref:hypothetical protein n=1 Tax=Desulfovibrio mangrovi TaxID=2976983 RepID=UPI0022452672|nr:hypothetical protein [Desulfovibrio mangrovi]UZP68629.1 hypothetical protein N1030_06555 [Desulfovibrio mangrovi]
MEIGGMNSAVRGYEAYAKAAATERLEAAAAAQQFRTQSSVGFKLGKFGVRYETEEPASSDDMMSEARSTLRESYVPDLETAGLRRQISAATQLEGAPESQWMRRYGANAYQQSEAAFARQSSMLQVTV